MATDLNDRTSAPSREDVPAEWLEPHLPTVFSRWHPYVAALQQATIKAIIAAARVRPGDAVVDIGCGSGIPALALAEAVGPSGRVTATDPSPVFVAAVAENARRLGLDNLEAMQASAVGLPFAAGSFDAATCHMGVMFFEDVEAGLGRIRAVLRPGGRAAFAAWGPDAENALFSSFWGAARPYLAAEAANEGEAGTPQTSTADASGPARFAAPGSLSAALRAVGYADIREEARTVDLVWPGPAETLRAFWLEVSRAEERVPAEQREAFRADVLASLRRYADGDAVRLPATVVLASGRS
jgi:SAM-dependent methyltransferase